MSKKGIYKNLCNHRLLDGVDDVGDVVEASGLVGGCHHVDGTRVSRRSRVEVLAHFGTYIFTNRKHKDTMFTAVGTDRTEAEREEG